MQIDWSHFTPGASFAGGLLIGLAAALFVLLKGRVLGVSGIVGGLLSPRRRDAAWRALFASGLVAGGLCLRMLVADPFHGLASTAPAVLVPAGLLVGFGASLGNGCTSGHGIFGLANLELPSLVTTVSFLGAGIMTTQIVYRVLFPMAGL